MSKQKFFDSGNEFEANSRLCWVWRHLSAALSTTNQIPVENESQQKLYFEVHPWGTEIAGKKTHRRDPRGKENIIQNFADTPRMGISY